MQVLKNYTFYTFIKKIKRKARLQADLTNGRES
jgi:hypothetical protein